jgi:hypothetical protein
VGLPSKSCNSVMIFFSFPGTALHRAYLVLLQSRGLNDVSDMQLALSGATAFAIRDLVFFEKSRLCCV